MTTQAEFVAAYIAARLSEARRKGFEHMTRVAVNEWESSQTPERIEAARLVALGGQEWRFGNGQHRVYFNNVALPGHELCPIDGYFDVKAGTWHPDAIDVTAEAFRAAVGA